MTMQMVVRSLVMVAFWAAVVILWPTSVPARTAVAVPAVTESVSVSLLATDSSDKSLAATLDRISAAAAGVNTISSRMEQEKHLSVFSEVIKTWGRFAFQRPDCWRWELLEPVASGIMVCGDRGRRWHENGEGPQLFKLDDEPWLNHFATQVTAWTTADFTFLKEQYILTLLSQSPPTLKLVPKEAAARHLIAAIEITFSEDYRYVVQIVIHDSGSDYTVIKFIDVTINHPLPTDYFK